MEIILNKFNSSNQVNIEQLPKKFKIFTFALGISLLKFSCLTKPQKNGFSNSVYMLESGKCNHSGHRFK